MYLTVLNNKVKIWRQIFEQNSVLHQAVMRREGREREKVSERWLEEDKEKKLNWELREETERKNHSGCPWWQPCRAQVRGG